jgi:NADH-quinone oxidoreductase subunit N
MVDPSSVNLLIVFPELMQLLLICALLMFAVFFSHVHIHPYENPHAQLQLQPQPHLHSQPQQQQTSCLASCLACRLARVPFPTVCTDPMAQLMVLGFVTSACAYGLNNLSSVIAFHTLTWDSVACFSSILLCLSSAASVCLAKQSFKRLSRYEFLLLIWLTTLGMLCLIKCVNFLAFYLSIELQSLSSFMLAATRSRTEASAEAGLKYFILSAFSSAILLLGMCICYGAVGSLNFEDLALSATHFRHFRQKTHQQKQKQELEQEQEEEEDYGDIQAQVTLGLCCICVSLLFKLAAAPLHLWIADVFEGTMTAITAFFAIASKIAVATALIRVLGNNLFPLTEETQGQGQGFDLWIIAVISAASLVVGSLSAMRQVKLKRLMAFSGVANVGWFLLALVCGQWQLLFLHMLIYIGQSIAIFSIFITPLFRSQPDLRYEYRESTRDYGVFGLTIKYIHDLNQMCKAHPSVAAALIVILFSFAGMPPLAGFYSKYLIINALAQNQIYALLAVALGVSVLSSFYYLRIIKTMYFSAYTIAPVLFFRNTQINNKVISKTKLTDCVTKWELEPWWFSFQIVPANAILICWITLVIITWFTKPDYACVWLLLM